MANPTEHDFLTCAECLRYDKLSAQLNAFSPDFERKHSLLWREYVNSCPATKHNQPNKTHKGNGTHKGIWAGTLTVSPKDDLNKEDMIVAIKKIMRQKSCPVKEYVWYLENTTAGLPHVHFMYRTETGGRIERKHFKRLWHIWDEDTKCGAGHRGGYHRPCHSETEYLAYVKKDDSPDHEDTWDTHKNEI